MTAPQQRSRKRLGFYASIIACGFWAVLGSWAEEPTPVPVPPGEKPSTDEPEAAAPSKEEVNRMIDALSSDDFAEREKAQKSLREAIVNAEIAEAIRLRYVASDNPEIKHRLRRTLHSALKNGLYTTPKKAFLGVQMQDSVMIGGKDGREMVLSVMVTDVIPDSAAESHGVEIGDHIMSVEGKKFTASPSTEFKTMIGAFKAGDKVNLRLRRGGAESDKKVELGEMPVDLLYIDPAIEQQRFDSFFENWLQEGGEIVKP